MVPDVDRPPCAFAYYFAAEGLRILPAYERSKEPSIRNWQNYATSDIEQLAKWFGKNGEANYGLLMGDGLIAVDVDPRHGGNFWLDDNEHRLPETWRFKTGGNGIHLVYRVPGARPRRQNWTQTKIIRNRPRTTSINRLPPAMVASLGVELLGCRRSRYTAGSDSRSDGEQKRAAT